ncbi:zinc finger protein 710-like [Dreissena polymorpha]|uniref:C2H2-type domain-containing protein n=1 Tax=Dreissena polymorpha TaxID=45954 RepID=A0A9D4KPK4_DREPO|nr:zinc finger protein 710-like [Dreissena polymorpha]XP_052278412.1 zinc finger protein 710-like [Dreissena polymorpha]XP_052278413.1 zinc finger protein 710-like [Dreissena polymorpha]XP_052278414.1 zinc finger protein 710-like [Dreissena polymorpha]XP_052278415.1 zinc finger protein 710-like [Dreissena polymorpha]KAH3843486.1 hypothetical protein DPMN_117004 [Dreissena polymorpha]
METKYNPNYSDQGDTIAKTVTGVSLATGLSEGTANNNSMPYNINNLWVKNNTNWFSAIMQKYAYVSEEEDNIERKIDIQLKYHPNELEQCGSQMFAIKGGRKDPENPFNITSPSFGQSAARAILTTVQSSTCTDVTVSIMSIGKADRFIPKVVKSRAAKGGILSIGKTHKAENHSTVPGEGSDLMHHRFGGKQIERFDINVKIKHDQMIEDGLEKRWQCVLCEKSYTSKHNLVTHILDHSGIRPHLCLRCGKYFRQLSHLNAHMLTHDKVRPHECQVCRKCFTQTGHLKRHMLVHSGQHASVCHICCRGFTTDDDLLAHMVKHETMLEQCSVCGEQFESHKLLMEHAVLAMHSQRTRCDKCALEFDSSADLQNHKKEAHGALRPWKCRQCGLAFLKVHQLKSHLFTHTGACPFACSECGRSFNQKANLRRHMLIHRGERSFKCHVCEKSFTQPQTLKTHMLVHANTMPYQCKICFRKFSRHHNLKGHMHVHNNSRPFDCSICECSFTLRGNLNRHMRMKHNIDSIEEEEEATDQGGPSDGAGMNSTELKADLKFDICETDDSVTEELDHCPGSSSKCEPYDVEHVKCVLDLHESEIQSSATRSHRHRKRKKFDDMFVV